MPPLIPCPHCEQHAKSSESTCPHCGAPLRDTRGRIARTATAAVLGLVAVAGCQKTAVPVAEYGPAPTVTDSPDPSPNASTAPSAAPLDEPVAEYGPAPTHDEPVDEYGPPPTLDEPRNEPVEEYGPPPTLNGPSD